MSSCRCSSFRATCRIETRSRKIWLMTHCDTTSSIRYVFCPLYNCTVRYFSMCRNCSTWCRNVLLSFSTCYLGILGLEGAINCILARTSHQRTTSEKRTKALLPKCPLFGGSTVAGKQQKSKSRVQKIASLTLAIAITDWIYMTN